MGMSLSTPRSAVKSFYGFHDVLNIDLKPVDFATLAGKVRGAGGRARAARLPPPAVAAAACRRRLPASRRLHPILRLLRGLPPQVVLVSNVASK